MNPISWETVNKTVTGKKKEHKKIQYDVKLNMTQSISVTGFVMELLMQTYIYIYPVGAVRPFKW